MKSENMRAHRSNYNKVILESDLFFKQFGELDEEVYAEGLGISVATLCISDA